MDKKSSKSKSGARFMLMTMFIKVCFLVALIVGVPYIIMKVLGNYERKASGIVDQQSGAMSAFSGANSTTSDQINQIKVLSTEEAIMIAKITDFIDGEWVSDQDGRYRLSIDSNYKFDEYYDDKREGYGVWRIFSSMKLSSIRAMADDPNAEVEPEYDYYFQKQQYEPDHKGETYKYRIEELDEHTFMMVFAEGSGKPLVFRKATSAAPVAATE